MIKEDVLNKIGFRELVGTHFEELMEIKKYKTGENILDTLDRYIGATFVYRGIIVANIFTSEGKEHYRYFEQDSLLGVAESMEGGYVDEYTQEYGVDLKAVGDTTLVFIPLKDIFKYAGENEITFYKRIIGLIRREKKVHDLYSTGRLIYSDEEFILKAFENRGEFYMKRQDLAKALNVSLRNLQRYMKYYIEIGILEKDGRHIYIKDRDKFNEYMDSVFHK